MAHLRIFTLDLKGIDHASLVLIMGMGAVACVAPIISGLNRKPVAQPVRQINSLQCTLLLRH